MRGDGRGNPSILILGAGVAGWALACALGERGLSAEVVERSPAGVGGGHAVDVRGAAAEVATRLGVADELRGRRTRVQGMSLLDVAGRELRRIEGANATGDATGGEDVEIFRDDLVGILRSHAERRSAVRYDDHPATLDETEGGVRVRFASGREGRYDVVIGADGLDSWARRRLFGDPPGVVRSLGQRLAIFGVPNAIDLVDWQLAFFAADRACIVYPTRDNAGLRVFFGFADDGGVGATRPEDAILRFRDLGGPIGMIVDDLPSARDGYLTRVAQVHLPRWSMGRVALLGDAAWCCGPTSGQGTSAALVGAYVLAEELGRAPWHHSVAFERFERRMRPFVAAAQALAGVGGAGPPEPSLVDQAKWAIDLRSDRVD